MKKYVVMLISLFLFSASSAFAETCPEDHTCIPPDIIEEINEVLLFQECLAYELEHSLIEYKASSLDIIVTEDGQVFSNDKLETTLRWCGMEILLIQDIQLHRSIKPKDPEWGFRFRVRLGTLFLPTNVLSIEPYLDYAVLLEPFHYRSLSLAAHIGINTVGLGLGLDITRNFNVYGGIAFPYKEPETLLPVLGVSFSFN